MASRDPFGARASSNFQGFFFCPKRLLGNDSDKERCLTEKCSEEGSEKAIRMALRRNSSGKVTRNPLLRECRAYWPCGVTSSALPIREFLLLDDRQITHLSCVRLKKLLLYMIFFGGVWGLLYKKQQEGGPKHPPKSHIANALGGHRLDE